MTEQQHKEMVSTLAKTGQEIFSELFEKFTIYQKTTDMEKLLKGLEDTEWALGRVRQLLGIRRNLPFC